MRRRSLCAMSPLTLLVYVTTITASVRATIFSAPTGVDELAQIFLKYDATTWTDLASINETNNKTRDDVARLVLSRYIEFAEQREQLIDVAHDVTNDDWLRALEQDRRWLQVYGELRQVRNAYKQWRRVITAEGGTAKQQWLQFARTALGIADGTLLKDGRTLDAVLDEISRQVTERNLFNNALLKALDERESCRLQTSPNRLLYELYETVALAQLDGFVVLQWSRALLSLEGEAEGKATAAAKMRINYEKERAKTRDKAKVALAVSDRSVWQCDPPRGHSSANGTYDELTQLLQGYIENEKDMNPRSNCLQDCAYYDYTKNMGCYHGYCKRQKRMCRGKILECQFVASDMTVCEADQRSNRRYEYIEYDNSRTFGHNTGCPNVRNVRVESWWRWLFWHCSYCMCLCDDETSPRTDRFWSLRPSLSDAARDMVVTGVRLVKIDRVIHLQVQQAKLAKRGRVDVKTTQWRPIEPLLIDAPSTKEGRDYHTMSYEKRDLDLDDVIVPTGHVVVGVKWRVIGAHLNLEVLSAPIDWITGKLIRPQEKSYWVSSDVTLEREKLQLHQPDVPTRQTQLSKVDSNTDMYVEFRNSDMEEDAGQTTVPFLDTQRVASDPPAPLSGVGLYHKGQRGYGGYVAPKVITYDYLPHMHD